MKSVVHKLLITMVVVSLLAVGLAACGSTAAPEPTAAPPAAAGPTEAPATAVPPAEPKVAKFIWTQEFDTLSPLYTNMWFSAITFQIWSCYAWDFDEEASPVPVMVTEMPSMANGGISEDGKTITIKLRDDMTWSDGTPLTAKDFVFTWEMTVNPANAVASTYPYDQMTAVEAPDDYTVVMTFVEPFAPWVGTLWHGIIPEHILRPVFEAEGTIDRAEWNLNPTVGCGPFNFVEWESGSFARFVANDNYWFGRPKLDEIFMRFVPDDASQVAALQTGDGDLGTFISYADIPTLESANVEMVSAFSGYNEGIYYYLHEEKGHPALKDINVRKAIALGIDRFSVCEDLLMGLTVPAMTDWDNTDWNDPTLEPWPYDPEEAKKILDEAGWVDSNGDGSRDKDGVELVFDYGTTTREIRRDTQAVFQQQLADIGIKVNLLNYDSDIFFETYGNGGPAAIGELDLVQFSTTFNFPDPDSADWLCNEIPSDEYPAGVSTAQICDEELDGLFALQRTQVDIAQRQETWHKITKHIFDNLYWLGVWQDPDIWAVGPRLQNVKISGATPFFNIIEWDLTQ
ncbi:MAG: peptide ABC transporter substrate-binding protein [Anaerolineae bacterium]|nr:peptide ABC transporter substrate-binding protein [Anaerolineae bacterium]